MKSKLFKLISLAMVMIMAFSFLPGILAQGAYSIAACSAATTSSTEMGAGTPSVSIGGQSFTLSAANQISSIDVYMKKTGSPTGTFNLRLETDSGSNKPSNGVMATSSGLNVATGLTTSFQWINFTFSPSVSVNATTKYWVVMLNTGVSTDGSNTVSWGKADPGGYSGGGMITGGSIGPSWNTESGTADMNFQVWGDTFISGAIVSTGTASAASLTTATLGGSIDGLSGSTNMTIRGIQMGTSTGNYTSNWTETGSYGVGSYYETATGLTANTTYYYRAEAYDTSWHYGAESAFLFNPSAPSVTTLLALYNTASSATAYGLVTALGLGGNYTERQIQVGTSTGNYTSNFTENGNWSGYGFLGGGFGENMTGLSNNVTYYYRAGAYDGTWGYGSEETYVHTVPSVSVTTGTATPYYGTSASAGFTGSLSTGDGGNVTAVQFQIGASTGAYTSNITNSSIDVSGNYTFTGNMTSLTSGTTYYWRAGAMDGLGWHYGVEKTFTEYFAPQLVATSAANGALLSTFVITVVDPGALPLTELGMQLGTSTGIYSIPVQPASMQGVSLNGTGYYILSGPLLTTNTTYYWRAYATNFQSGTVGVGYSLEVSFITGAGSTVYPPTVTTDGAIANGTMTANAATFTGTVVAAGAPIIAEGFQWGYATGNYSGGTLEQDGNFPVGQPFVLGTPHILTEGSRVYYRAWAKVQGQSLAGYGAEKYIDLPGAGSGLLVVTNGSTVMGSSAILNGKLTASNIFQASWTNPSLVAFSWGTDTSGHQYGWSTAFTSDMQSFDHASWTYTVQNLLPSTTYYWRAKIFVGDSWIESALPAATFTTGSDSTVHIGVPTVNTIAPDLSHVGVNSFIATGQLVDKGGSDVLQEGFDVGILNTSWDQALPMTGNFSVGYFSMNLTSSSWHEGDTIYFRAWAKNSANQTGYGAQKGVKLATTGGGPPEDVTPPPAPVSNVLTRILRGLGMDNTFGHWASLSVLLLIVMVFTVICVLMIEEREKLIKRVIAVFGLAIGTSVFGTYLWSGLLNIFAVGAMAVFVAVILTLFAGKKYSGGGGA